MIKLHMHMAMADEVPVPLSADELATLRGELVGCNPHYVLCRLVATIDARDVEISDLQAAILRMQEVK